MNVAFYALSCISDDSLKRVSDTDIGKIEVEHTMAKNTACLDSGNP